MATVKHVEAKVWRVERFRARLHYEQPGRRQGRDVRSDRGQLPPYPYVRAARADSTVAEWIAKRFEGTYPGLTAEVLNGQGHVVHGRTKLETVRRSYS